MSVSEAPLRVSLDARSSWSGSVLLVCSLALLSGAMTVAAFAPTFGSIVHAWNTSDTFAHGWFVAPLALGLAWHRRGQLPSQVTWSVQWWLILPLLAAGGLWLLSRAVHVQVGEQLGAVVALIVSMALVLGPTLARTFRFGLLFLLFLAPIGSELVPSMMEITADFTVGAIALTGIPIYREGLYFSIPSGDWSVVEACSGIRYLIASFMLGTLYAGLYLDGVARRAAFLVLALIIPIVANGIRAFLIVMIGHVSGMRLANGVDHLVYGWLFFGLVMFILFSIGARMVRRDVDAKPMSGGATTGAPDTVLSLRPHASLVATACVAAPLMGLSLGAYDSLLERQADQRLEQLDRHVWLPGADTPATLTAVEARPTDWAPNYRGEDAIERFDFPNGVTARAYVYAVETQGKELVGFNNRLVRAHPKVWHVIESRERVVEGDGDRSFTVHEAIVQRGADRVLVWRWYRVGGWRTADPLRAKLAGLAMRLRLDKRPSAAYVLSVDAEANHARDRLRAVAKAVDGSAEVEGQLDP